MRNAREDLRSPRPAHEDAVSLDWKQPWLAITHTPPRATTWNKSNWPPSSCAMPRTT